MRWQWKWKVAVEGLCWWHACAGGSGRPVLVAVEGLCPGSSWELQPHCIMLVLVAVEGPCVGIAAWDLVYPMFPYYASEPALHLRRCSLEMPRMRHEIMIRRVLWMPRMRH